MNSSCGTHHDALRGHAGVGLRHCLPQPPVDGKLERRSSRGPRNVPLTGYDGQGPQGRRGLPRSHQARRRAPAVHGLHARGPQGVRARGPQRVLGARDEPGGDKNAAWRGRESSHNRAHCVGHGSGHVGSNAGRGWVHQDHEGSSGGWDGARRGGHLRQHKRWRPPAHRPQACEQHSKLQRGRTAMLQRRSLGCGAVASRAHITATRRWATYETTRHVRYAGVLSEPSSLCLCKQRHAVPR